MSSVPEYAKNNSKFIHSTVKVDKSSTNVGSTAGAGSGDFHLYRQLWRKERYRLVKLEADARK